jgi:class 3 adenylate cyclase
MSTKVLTIVFTDIKGFTERTAASGRDFAIRIMARHDELLKPVIARYEGRLIKTIGDAYLLVFDSPTNAVLCALMMQETLRLVNPSVPPEEKIEIRIAIHTGEVNVLPDDILGEPVNVASRVEGITEVNEIWFTESTYLAMNKQEVPTSLVGEFRLKGVPESLRVYRVVQDPESQDFQRVLATQQKHLGVKLEPGAPGATGMDRKSPPVLGMLAGLIVLVFLGAMGWQWQVERQWQNELAVVARMIGQKQYDESLRRLTEMLVKRPEDPLAVQLVEQSVASSTEELIAAREFARAREKLNETAGRLPLAGVRETLDSRLAVAEALDNRNRGGKDAAETVIADLVAKYPTSSRVQYAAAMFYHTTGINWTRETQHFFQAASADPRILSDPAFLDWAEYFVTKVHPDDGYDEVRVFLAEKLFERFQEKLEKALYQLAPETRTLRWNARKMLHVRGVPVDPLRFFLTEIQDVENQERSVSNAEVYSFFLELPASGAVSMAALPDELSAYPAFDHRLMSADAVPMKIAAGVLQHPLRRFLRAALADREHHPRRINSRMALQAASVSLSLPEIVTFHEINVSAWNDGGLYDSYASFFRESLDFWATPSPESTADQAVKERIRPMLKRTVERTEQILARWPPNNTYRLQWWQDVLATGKAAVAAWE